MAKIHLNIGSNQDRKRHILAAIDALKSTFGELELSDLFESPAQGFSGDDFYNIGVNATTTMSIIEIADALKTIEKKIGRVASAPKFSARKIDLDLVFFDDVIDAAHNLPRADILQYAFVLAPLAQLNPQAIHPIAKQTYAQLWQTFQTENRAKLSQYNIDKILK